MVPKEGPSAMPGPLPQSQRRRRNAPAIPTTTLPAEGRSGPLPDVPSWVTLGKAGRAWWVWAWSTPQAAAWAAGHEGVVARRAQLEDDLVVLGERRLEFGELDDLDEQVVDRITLVVDTLKRLATAKLSVVREMRELDDRLGLTPKAMAQLRWTIGEPPSESEGSLTVVRSDRWAGRGA